MQCPTALYAMECSSERGCALAVVPLPPYVLCQACAGRRIDAGHESVVNPLNFDQALTDGMTPFRLYVLVWELAGPHCSRRC